MKEVKNLIILLTNLKAFFWKRMKDIIRENQFLKAFGRKKVEILNEISWKALMKLKNIRIKHMSQI